MVWQRSFGDIITTDQFSKPYSTKTLSHSQYILWVNKSSLNLEPLKCKGLHLVWIVGQSILNDNSYQLNSIPDSTKTLNHSQYILWVNKSSLNLEPLKQLFGSLSICVLTKGLMEMYCHKINENVKEKQISSILMQKQMVLYYYEYDS